MSSCCLSEEDQEYVDFFKYFVYIFGSLRQPTVTNIARDESELDEYIEHGTVREVIELAGYFYKKRVTVALAKRIYYKLVNLRQLWHANPRPLDGKSRSKILVVAEQTPWRYFHDFLRRVEFSTIFYELVPQSVARYYIAIQETPTKGLLNFREFGIVDEKRQYVRCNCENMTVLCSRCNGSLEGNVCLEDATHRFKNIHIRCFKIGRGHGQALPLDAVGVGVAVPASPDKQRFESQPLVHHAVPSTDDEGIDEPDSDEDDVFPDQREQFHPVKPVRERTPSPPSRNWPEIIGSTGSPPAVTLRPPAPIVEPPRPQIATPPTVPSYTQPPEEPLEDLNILLLGPTGVGKSSWITALTNYLYYATFDDAAHGGIQTPIPGRITLDSYGHALDYGQPSDNEIIYPGRATTQSPRHHHITVRGRGVNIIDTPGLGDSRGPVQDEITSRHIVDDLAAINGFLNAIALVLRADADEFEATTTQLLSILPRIAIPNLVFIFSFARATSFQINDAVNNLNRFFDRLERSNHVRIRLSHDTAYLIDNDAIRHLIVRASATPYRSAFDPPEAFHRAWGVSSEESSRLFDHILGVPPVHPLEILFLNAVRSVAEHLAYAMLSGETVDGHTHARRLRAYETVTDYLIQEAIIPIDPLLRQVTAAAGALPSHLSDSLFFDARGRRTTRVTKEEVLTELLQIRDSETTTRHLRESIEIIRVVIEETIHRTTMTTTEVFRPRLPSPTKPYNPPPPPPTTQQPSQTTIGTGVTTTHQTNIGTGVNNQSPTTPPRHQHHGIGAGASSIYDHLTREEIVHSRQPTPPLGNGATTFGSERPSRPRPTSVEIPTGSGVRPLRESQFSSETNRLKSDTYEYEINSYSYVTTEKTYKFPDIPPHHHNVSIHSSV